MVDSPSGIKSRTLQFDLSFIYSFKCNLQCSFCMYDGGPNCDEFLDLYRLEKWLSLFRMIDIERITSIGIYGGEPSLFIPENNAILDMVKHWAKPSFVITNGTWSTNSKKTWEFIDFVKRNKLRVVVSGTAEHRAYQNRAVLEMLKAFTPESITLKPLNENLHPMGRQALYQEFSCTKKCEWWDKGPHRIALTPMGEVIYQCCDGIYPVILPNSWPVFSEVVFEIEQCVRLGFDRICGYA